MNALDVAQRPTSCVLTAKGLLSHAHAHLLPELRCARFANTMLTK